jgi:hypothetical protein
MKGVHARLLAFAAIVALASGCAASSHTTATPPISPPTGIGGPLASREVSMRAEVQAKLRSGYFYQATGRVRSIEVAIGKLPIFRASPGDYVDIALARAPAERYHLRGATSAGRVTSDVTIPPGCVECDGTGGGSTPSPGPTPPPNFGPCSSSGGATWFNNATGTGGCTPRGGSQPLSCGTWTWSARSKGTLNVPGTGTFPNFDYAIDNGDGSCRLGTAS